MSRPITSAAADDQLLAVPASGPTLLPSPIASLISLFSKSTTISIRLGSLVGEVLLDSARASTLTSLEVGKAVIEGILIRAGHDVERRGGKGGEYVEGWTDKGIDFLNSTVSLTQLLVSTGFRLSSATLSTVSEIAQNYVYTLDSILGSTESSRAISAIVSLIRREIISADEERQRANLGDPTSQAVKIGVVDLIIGLTCFAIIQVRTRQRSLREIKTKIVWDAIVMDGGKKVSMSEDSRFSKVKATGPLDETILALSNGQQLLEGTNGENALHFLSKIPSNAEVNITTSTSTSQTTTIEISGASPPDFNPPKGAVIISESAEHGVHSKPSYKIVYQTTQETIKKRLRRKDGQLEVEVEDCGPDCNNNRVKALPDPREKENHKAHTTREGGRKLKGRKSSHSILSQFADHDPARYERSSRPNRPSLEIPDSTSTPAISLPSSPDRQHGSRRRSLSRSQTQPYPGSMYTLRTSRSQSSLLIQHDDEASAPSDPLLGSAIFPSGHLCRNMSKYMRFASASYGQNFMRVLGIGSAKAAKLAHPPHTHHYEHHAFSQHTNLPVDTILLSSFTDPGGGYDASGEVGTGVPLVHFVCVDHKAHAVVLTCRGTLGLEDVLTDLTCEYSDLKIRDETYRVHKGMLNSALLMLRTRSKVLTTIKLALEEFPTYGLVLTGHSLGGGVAAILSILLSEPRYRTSPNAGFITASSKLPQGRPIHCYAYGPPACVCPRLRTLTTGLITTTVFGADIVPSLSFGMIRDFYNVAVAFKQDANDAASEIRRRILRNLVSRKEAMGGDDDLYTVLKGLREHMQSEKLVPPGRVFWVESQVVFLKDLKSNKRSKSPSSERSSDSGSDNDDVPLPPGGAAGYAHATRITTKEVLDVEGAFREIGFGRGMISDHSPKNYEAALELLLRGVCDEEVEV